MAVSILLQPDELSALSPADLYQRSAGPYVFSRLCHRLILLLLLMLISATSANAHFRLNTNIRVVHLESTTNGLFLSIRQPAPLIFAEFANVDDGVNGLAPIPFTTSAIESGSLVHYLDKAAISNQQAEFGRFILDGYQLEHGGEVHAGEVLDVQIFSAEKQTAFTNLQQVKASFVADWLFQSDAPEFVGETVVDILIRYPPIAANGEIRLSSILQSKLPADTFIANLIISYQGGEQKLTRALGQLTTPVVLNPSHFNAVKEFVAQGFVHITSGLDHILFVLCLTISASTLFGLLWRVTGFTVGHSITLIAGFYGLVPQAGWFIPLVEVLIAVSIVFVGFIAVKKTATSATIVITVLIGLLHGFGFSFLLAELLSAESPHLISSLLSFNIGIELGQLLFVALTYGLLYAVNQYRTNLYLWSIRGIAFTSVIIALVMLIDRVPYFWTSIDL